MASLHTPEAHRPNQERQQGFVMPTNHRCCTHVFQPNQPMKFTFTFSILCFLNAVSASAQPTLTAATNMPIVGLRDKVYNSNQFAAGNPGASQTWDFSTLTYGASAFGTYQPCNTANGCSAYAGATMAYSYSSTFTYYKASANALSLMGFSSSGSPINYYTNPEDYLRFPLSYGSNYIDSLASSYNSGTGGTWYRKGVDTVTADGWGTLKTPAGTFPNTLRITRISTYIDTGIMMGLPDYIKWKEYTHTWYDVAHRDFLYSTRSITITPKSGAPQTVNYARYTSEQTPNVVPLVHAGLRCQVAPNPARGNVQIALSLDASGQALINLTDITGRVVRSLLAVDLAAGESKLSLPAEGLPGGIYILRVVAGDAVMAMKVVIE